VGRLIMIDDQNRHPKTTSKIDDHTDGSLLMKRLLACTLVAGLCSATAVAQPGRFPSGRSGSSQSAPQRGGGSRPGTPGSASLERAGVKLGQSLPELTIYQESGAKFRLADVKGRYTVIVFGCLT